VSPVKKIQLIAPTHTTPRGITCSDKEKRR
jgi:hypothetical protein